MTTVLKPTLVTGRDQTLARGESPAWIPDAGGGSLWAVDIKHQGGAMLYRLVINEGGPVSSLYSEGRRIGDEAASFAPLEGRPGELLVAKRDGLFMMEPVDVRVFSAHAHMELLVPAPYDRQILRFNDGKASPWGDFWVGTYDETGTRGSLYCYRDGALVTVVDGGAGSSNGLAWSPKGDLMYWADTRRHKVYVSVVAGGMPVEWEEFLTFSSRRDDPSYQGRPDGAAVDSEGNYWTAMYKGSQVRCYSPAGELLVVVDTSDFTDSPTMPCHGGPDLRTLFITGVDCPVMKVRVDVPGLPVNAVRL